MVFARGGCLWLGLAFLCFSLDGCVSPPPSPLPLVFWDWQPQLPLAATDLTLIQTHPIPFLMVQAGSLILKNGQPARQRKLTGETLASYQNVPLHLCYRASLDFIRAFQDMDPGAVGRELAVQVAQDIADAQSAGAVIRGVQLDFDCPTRLLPQYARMLSVFKEEIHRQGAYQVSITAMESWLHHPSFGQLLRQCDFYTPLLYGYDIPRIESRLPELSSTRRLAWALWLCRWWGKPYWIGLPAYCSALIYDDHGQLVTMGKDLSLGDLLGSRAVVYQNSAQRPGSFEMRHRFKVAQNISWEGWELHKGWEIEVEETTPAQWQALARILARKNTGPLQGVACFYWDKEKRGNSLLPEGVLALQSLPPPAHSIALAADFSSGTADAVQFSANLVNLDPFPSLLGFSPALLQIRIKDGYFESAGRGDFQSLGYAKGFQANTLRSSPERATVLNFTVARVLGLQRLATGTIRARKTGPQFAVYLYGRMDSSLLFKTIISRDDEVFPQPHRPFYQLQELTP